METEDPLITADKVAELFGVSNSAVRCWFRSGKIRGYRFGHRTLRFHLSEVIEDLKYTSKVGKVKVK